MRTVSRFGVLAFVGTVVMVSACSSSGSTAKSASPTTSSPKALTTSIDPASISAAKSAGCTRPAGSAVAGETKETMTSGGDARWYYQHIPPAGSGPAAMPLVLDLHGYSEGATVHLQMSALGTFGDTKGFITLTPQGTGPVAMWDTTLGSKDLTFLGELLDRAEAQLCVDTNRIFVTGLSNGAFMTSAVACQFSDRVAAVSPVAGVRNIKGCTPKRPVPIVAFHGTADGFVSYTGGLGEKALDLPAPDGSGKKLRDTLTPDQLKSGGGDSIPAIMAAWANRSHCGAGTTETTVTADVTKITYHCPASAETVLYRVTGGGHSWPGSTFSQAIASVVGPTTTSINADQIMWDFFVKHPLNSPKA